MSVGAIVTFHLMIPRLGCQDRYAELTLGVVSVLQAILLITMAKTSSIWLAYVFFIIFTASYQMLATIAM